MPAIGFGTWSLDDGSAESVVADAIRAGYRMIDTAASYRNEVGVGYGVRCSGVDRADLFVISKLDDPDHGHERALRAYDASLARLGLDYLDLYLIHWPVPWADRFVDSWRALVRLRDDGRVRAIGVSNFLPAHLERIIGRTKCVPDVLQIQLSPRVTQDESRAYARERGITIQSWSPLGNGDGLLDEPVVREVADRHGRSSAQVVLRWHLDQGLVPIAKSSDPQRLRENLDLGGFNLTAVDMRDMAALRGTGAVVDPTLFGRPT
jgi:2,5-diketo-D-gluconate reductase A